MLRGTRPRRRVIGPKVGSLKGTSNSGVKALTLEQSMAFGWTYPESPKVDKPRGAPIFITIRLLIADSAT
jgi:hypothetical protein